MFTGRAVPGKGEVICVLRSDGTWKYAEFIDMIGDAIVVKASKLLGTAPRR